MITLAELSTLRSRSAVESFLTTRYSDDSEAAVRALDAGLNAVLRNDLKDARLYVRRAARVFACLPDRYLPRLLAMEARLFHFSGRHQEALRKYLAAQSAYRSQRESVNVARLNRVLAEVYMYLGQYREALLAGRKAIRYFEAHELLSDAAQAMTNVGNVYHRMDNNRLALHYYDKARAIFAGQGGVPVAIVDYNRANVLTNLFRLSEARTLYEGASAIYASAGLTIPETLCQYSIAYLCFLDGRYTEALSLFERVLDRFEQVGDMRSAAVTRLDLAELHLQLNQYGSAITLADEVAGQFRSLKMAYEEGKARYFEASGQLSLGDNAEAAACLRAAERIFIREGNELWQGMVHFARCRLLMARARYRDAAEESTRARRLFRRSRDERRAVDADIAQLGALLMSRRGVAPMRVARNLLDMTLTKYQQYSVQRLLGDFHYRRGDYVTALNHLRPAIEAVESMASRLNYDDVRHFFVADKLDSYRHLVHSLLELKQTDDAFVHSLGALSLVNRPSAVTRQLRAEIPRSVADEIDKLRLTLRRYQQFPRTGQRSGSTLVSVRAAEQRLWALEQKARASVSTPVTRERVHRGDAFDVHSALRPDETLVHYTMRGGRIGAFVAAAGDTTWVPMEVDSDRLYADVRKLHFLFETAVRGRSEGPVRTGTAVESLLSSLHSSLVAPFGGLLRTPRLIVLADGVFVEVPFGALGSTSNPLGRQYDLRLIVDPGQVTWRSPEPSDWITRSHAVFSVSSPTLPSADDEAKEIAGLFPRARLYSGEAATCDVLRRELMEANGLVHIATHASRSSENPLFSRMLMYDGPFFPFDLFGTGVRAQLTTLSGCQTAAPGLNYGNSFSLARAFYQAGSRYVLASLWPVSDSLTRVFMVELYRSLQRGKNVPQAYTAAVDTIRALAPSVAYWGSFVLLGL